MFTLKQLTNLILNYNVNFSLDKGIEKRKGVSYFQAFL